MGTTDTTVRQKLAQHRKVIFHCGYNCVLYVQSIQPALRWHILRTAVWISTTKRLPIIVTMVTTWLVVINTAIATTEAGIARHPNASPTRVRNKHVSPRRSTVVTTVVLFIAQVPSIRRPKTWNLVWNRLLNVTSDLWVYARILFESFVFLDVCENVGDIN